MAAQRAWFQLVCPSCDHALSAHLPSLPRSLSTRLPHQQHVGCAVQERQCVACALLSLQISIVSPSKAALPLHEHVRGAIIMRRMLALLNFLPDCACSRARRLLARASVRHRRLHFHGRHPLGRPWYTSCSSVWRSHNRISKSGCHRSKLAPWL